MGCATYPGRGMTGAAARSACARGCMCSVPQREWKANAQTRPSSDRIVSNPPMTDGGAVDSPQNAHVIIIWLWRLSLTFSSFVAVPA